MRCCGRGILGRMKSLKIIIALILAAVLTFVLYQQRVHAPVSLESSVHYFGEGAERMIVIDFPSPGQVVSSPFVVKGKVRGGWAFEGGFPVVLTDWDGRIIVEAPAKLLGSWMTNEFVPFEVTVTFETPEDIGDFSDGGFLILKKDNPSGIPENDAAAEMRVRFR